MIIYYNTTVRKVKNVVLRNCLWSLASRDAYMRAMLERNPYRVPIVIAIEDGRPVGWSFCEKGLIGVYVHKMRRMQGIGQALVKAVAPRGRRKQFYVSAHDWTSRAFFRKVSGGNTRPNRERYGEWDINAKIVV